MTAGGEGRRNTVQKFCSVLFLTRKLLKFEIIWRDEFETLFGMTEKEFAKPLADLERQVARF